MMSTADDGSTTTAEITSASSENATDMPAVITVTDSLSGESQSFTLTVTPILVTDAGDSGPGTLRQALLDAAGYQAVCSADA